MKWVRFSFGRYPDFNTLRKLTPQACGIVITLEPAVAAVIGIFALGNMLGPEGLIAIACVTLAAIGSTLTQTSGRR